MSKTARIKKWARLESLLVAACAAYEDFWWETNRNDAKITGLIAWLQNRYEMKPAMAARVSRLLRVSGLIPTPTFPSGETILFVTDAGLSEVTVEQLRKLLGLEMPETVDA